MSSTNFTVDLYNTLDQMTLITNDKCLNYNLYIYYIAWNVIYKTVPIKRYLGSSIAFKKKSGVFWSYLMHENMYNILNMSKYGQIPD